MAMDAAIELGGSRALSTRDRQATVRSPRTLRLGFPIWLLSKRMSQPTYESMAQLKRLVRYLLGTTSLSRL